MNIVNIKLEGLTCAACVKFASSRIRKIPGVEDVRIDLGTGAAEVASLADVDIDLIRLSLADTSYKIIK
jgi:copper chaperone CopZ